MGKPWLYNSSHVVPLLYTFLPLQVRKVVKAYKASLEDELDLFVGDYIFMDPGEVDRSEDGWYTGSSWVSGMVGLFPGTYTQKTAQTWAWALHG